jgi:hypothetical protein
VGRLTLTYAAARNCSVIHSVPNGAQAVGAVVSHLVAASGDYELDQPPRSLHSTWHFDRASDALRNTPKRQPGGCGEHPPRMHAPVPRRNHQFGNALQVSVGNGAGSKPAVPMGL